MKYGDHFLLFLLIIVLSGCAYTPKHVEASRPLVNQVASSERQAMPVNLQQPLNILPSGSSLSASGASFILGQRYISALGQECIELLHGSNDYQTGRGITCKNGEIWYLISQLDQTAANNLLAAH